MDGTSTPISVGKKFGVSLRAPVNVHHESPHAAADQMIKCPGDQRAIAERNQRFWPAIREWTQPCTEPRTQDKCGLHSLLDDLVGLGSATTRFLGRVFIVRVRIVIHSTLLVLFRAAFLLLGLRLRKVLQRAADDGADI